MSINPEPWHVDAVELVKDSLEHLSTVSVVTQDDMVHELAVESLAVTFAEDWSPHVQVTVDVALPAALEFLEELDGRKGARLQVDAGYVYPDGRTDRHLLADVGLQERRILRPANTVQLTACSDEVRAQDTLHRFTSTALDHADTNAGFRYFMEKAMAPEELIFTSQFPEGWNAQALQDMPLDTGESMWEAMAELAAFQDMWVYCDGLRRWRVRSRPTVGGEPMAYLATGSRGTVVQSETALDRTEFYNSAVVRYKWRDLNGVDQQTIGRAQAWGGDLGVQTVGWKTLFVDVDRRARQDRADAYARTLVSQSITRGRGVTVTAVAAYWLRPGMTVTVALPTGNVEDHLVRSVTFRPGEGLMDVVTRQPLDLTITTGE